MSAESSYHNVLQNIHHRSCNLSSRMADFSMVFIWSAEVVSCSQVAVTAFDCSVGFLMSVSTQKNRPVDHSGDIGGMTAGLGRFSFKEADVHGSKSGGVTEHVAPLVDAFLKTSGPKLSRSWEREDRLALKRMQQALTRQPVLASSASHVTRPHRSIKPSQIAVHPDHVKQAFDYAENSQWDSSDVEEDAIQQGTQLTQSFRKRENRHATGMNACKDDTAHRKHALLESASKSSFARASHGCRSFKACRDGFLFHSSLTFDRNVANAAENNKKKNQALIRCALATVGLPGSKQEKHLRKGRKSEQRKPATRRQSVLKRQELCGKAYNTANELVSQNHVAGKSAAGSSTRKRVHWVVKSFKTKAVINDLRLQLKASEEAKKLSEDRIMSIKSRYH